jgi:putative CocE/NonD family hydrolase
VSGPTTAPRLRGWARRGYAETAGDGQLGPATNGPVLVERDLPIAAADGTVLRADHWWPGPRRDGGPEPSRVPVVLVRTPYGRGGQDLVGHLFAERGYHVVVNACRGTSGSGGRFEPLADEVGDGGDVLRWLEGQPWAGSVHTFGFSYVGVTQWALCDAAPGRVVSMLVGVSARSMGPAVFHVGGGTSLETMVTWAYTLSFNGRSAPRQMLAWILGRRRVARACDALPPDDAFRVATGHDVPYARQWLAHGPDDPWWRARAYAQDPAHIPPVTLLAGWQDMFLVDQVADFRALRAAGRPVRLVVGPWAHTQVPTGPAVAEALRRLRGEASDTPVSVAVTGDDGWRDLADWPPPSRRTTLNLHADGGLDVSPAPQGESRFRYDPGHPTPMAGGRGLNPFTFGNRPQRARESRDDVLVWTGRALEADLVVTGDPVARVVLSSTNPSPDLFVRLCDVDERGVSTTVSDGYRRFAAALDGPREVELALAPLAHRFRAGHRIRLQVSAGAHPLHLRNLAPDAGRLPPPSTYQVGHGPAGSRLELPVVDW